MTNILFLETGIPTIEGGAGGSVYSLLEIVKGIHKKDYNITILFYNYFNISPQFNKLNCNVIIKNNRNNHLQNENKSLVLKNKNPGNSFIKWIKFNLSWIKLIADIKYIVKILKENNIHILHCNDRLSTNISGIIAAKLIGIKVYVHQRQYEQNLPLFTKYFGKKVDVFFTISNSITKNLRAKLSIKENKIELLYNWISIPNKNKKTNKENFKNILWFGRIIPWKGTHLLIKIVEHFLRFNINFEKVIIYGEADPSSKEYLSFIKEEINKRKLSKYFEFRGYKVFEEIDTTEFKAYFHTSLEPEPFGRTIIESMNSYLPVFATNFGGVKDIIIDSENGFLYQPENISELADKFLLLDNQEFRSLICLKGKETVRNKFSGEKQITTLLGYYI